jgi:spore coat polysaccharide biosynthesis protein SpsF
MLDNIKLRIILIVQARMGSTRLPGKILREVLDKPLLAYEIERLRRVSKVDEVVIATTKNPSDKPVVDFCQHEQVPIFRGSEEDVLDRFFRAAKAFSADVVVRVSGDCPLIDHNIVDEVIQFYLDHYPEYTYVSNTLERTYPRGLDVEVFSFEALKKTAKEAVKPEEREHVTPYIYGYPDRFALGSVIHSPDLSGHRWTVDTEEDFELIDKLLRVLYPVKPDFTMEDVLGQLDDHPEWASINAHIQQKPLRL